MPRPKQFDEKEVLKKAMVLFWKNGYHNTSIEDLVVELDIKRGSLYATFGGKKALFEQALKLYRTMNREKLGQFLQSQQNVLIGLRLLFKDLIAADFQDDDCMGCFVVNTTTELLPADKKMESDLIAHKVGTEDEFYKFLEKGVETGQISKEIDIKMISKLLYTFMNGLRVNGKIKPAQEESLAQAEAIIGLLK